MSVAGSRLNWSSFVAAEADRAYRIALRACGSTALAEEAVQEAFAQLVQRPPVVTSEDELRGYFFKTVRGKAIDLQRSEARQRRLAEANVERPSTPEPQSGGDTAERTAALRTALDTLPEDEREAVGLCCEQGLTHAVAASILGVPRRTVTDRLNRGLDRLRFSLAAGGFATAVVVSEASLTEGLRELAGPTAPRHLVENLHLLANGARQSLRLAAAKGTSKAGFVAVAAVLAAATAGVIWWMQSPALIVKAPSAAVAPGIDVPTPEAGRTIQVPLVWNFDQGASTAFERAAGNSQGWRHVKDAGTGKTGCIEILDGTKFKLSLDIAPPAQPLLLEFKVQAIVKKNFGWNITWTKFRTMAQMQHIAKNLQPAPNNWFNVRIFITREAIDCWMLAKRTGLTFYEPLPEAMLHFGLTGGHFYIDDFTLRPAQANELPDIRAYQTALAALPPVKELGFVALPGLKSEIPGQEAGVTFADETAARERNLIP